RDAAGVEGLEKRPRGLAERRGFSNQHRHRVPAPSLPQERGADRVIVTVSSQPGELAPERAAIVPKRLFDGLTLGRRPPDPTQSDLSQLAERSFGLADALIGGADPPSDRQRRIGLDAGAPGVCGTREE